jgi:hypothetical protein
MSKQRRTVIISDIHGCLEEFEELLAKLEYHREKDRLIIAGDLIDRGPNSPGVVRKIRELNLESICGNHDAKFLKWFRNQGTNQEQFYSGKDYYCQFSDADINYLAQMPYYLKLPEHNAIVIHAGLRAYLPIEKQDRQDLLYLRYCDSDHKFVSLKKIAKLGKEEADAHFWTEFGPFGCDVVYGHNVNSMENIRIDKYEDGTSCFGIDTGCCFGGRLTALVLDTKEVIQVRAKQVYHQSRFSI